MLLQGTSSLHHDFLVSGPAISLFQISSNTGDPSFNALLWKLLKTLGVCRQYTMLASKQCIHSAPAEAPNQTPSQHPDVLCLPYTYRSLL